MFFISDEFLIHSPFGNRHDMVNILWWTIQIFTKGRSDKNSLDAFKSGWLTDDNNKLENIYAEAIQKCVALFENIPKQIKQQTFSPEIAATMNALQRVLEVLGRKVRVTANLNNGVQSKSPRTISVNSSSGTNSIIAQFQIPIPKTAAEQLHTILREKFVMNEFRHEQDQVHFEKPRYVAWSHTQSGNPNLNWNVRRTT